MRKLFLTIFGVLVLAMTILAQTAGNETEKDKAEKEKREKKAMELLDQVLAETQSLKLPENRLRLKVMAAGYLWEKDEPRARAYFQESENDLRQMIQAISAETENRQAKIETYNQFRHELLRNLSQLDPQLALQLLRASRLPDELKRPTAGNYDPDQQLENELTTRAASRNPTQALKTAEELLQKGFSPQILSLVDAIRWDEKSRPAITQLYQQVIRKLATEDILGNNEALALTESLLQRAYGESYLRTNASQANGARLPQTITDEQMLRELIELAAKAAVKPSTDSLHSNNANQLKNTLQSIQPAVNKYAPAQSAQLKPRGTAGTPIGSEWQRTANSEFYTLANNPATTPDQLLEYVKKAPPQEQNNLYTQIAMRLVSRGDADRAKQIIETNVKDPEAKERFDRMYETTRLRNAVSKGEVEAAKQMMANLPSLTNKVDLLVQLATQLAAKGDKVAASNLLEEAAAIIGTQVENHQQVYSLVNLARSFATVSPDRSFELADAMVARFNPVLTATSVLDSFEMRKGFEQGEARLGGSGSMYWLGTFNEGLRYLAPFDVDRAKATAERFERPEIRLQALLFVAGGILHSKAQVLSNYNVPPPPPPPPPVQRRP
ncbi:MAG: hypothetical protein JST84_07875 [Acidobacteria bacterium]|nr:hypothetical protein [Acidobacteriota bacterium]